VCAALLATAAAMPYLLAVAGGASRLGELIDPSVRRAVAIACSGFALLLLGALGMRATLVHAGAAGRLVAVTGIGLTILALALRLPGTERAQTMDKNPYFLTLGLGVPAGWALADLWARAAARGRRRLAAWGIVALLAPANVAMLAGYALLPDRFETSPSERALYEWARAHTPRDAVFLVGRNADYRDRMRLPVLGPRRVFAGADHLAREWGYPEGEISRRAALEEAIFDRGAVGPADVAAQVGGRAPIFLLRWPAAGGEGAPEPDPLAERYRPRFVAGEFRVYEVRGERAEPSSGP
jgi:hypothetical protein